MYKKSIGVVLVMILFCWSCRNNRLYDVAKLNPEMKVDIEVLLQDTTFNVRALEINRNKNGASFALTNGKIGTTRLNDLKKVHLSLELMHDTIIPNFRSMSITNRADFALSVATPVLLYKIDNDSIKLVYTETHENAFYDSMDFWNDQEGIAIGDPTEDCMSIIITRDAGNTWTKLSCDNLPKAKDGEAAFAASDTNIAIVGHHTWVATGGAASRILYSPDKGRSWWVFNTPIVQGKPTTGIYSMDFYDTNNGFAIGGDYTKPADSSANKIRTSDGGKTWILVAENKSPGYRSCVQYVPNGNAKKLVAVGSNGIDYSADAGNSWQHLSDEGFYTIRFLNDSVAFAGGNGRVAKLEFSGE